MTDVHHLPSIEDAERQASDWIARLQADDVSFDDRVRFEAWRNAHPRHARAYDELMATWQQFSDAGRTVRAVSFGTAMQAATQMKRRRDGVIAFAAAAVLAVIALGGWWQWRAPSTFETGIGEHIAVTLPDGSRLELNSNSAVQVAYSDSTRLIRLERGEAFFTVAHAPERPFWVVTDRTWVRAVGTAFNVYRREGDVRVTVSQGRVKVAAATGSRDMPSDAALARLPASLLEAGQQADLRGTTTQVRRLPLPDVDREVAWRSGTVYFENRPLHEVVDELARYTPLRIELGSDARDLPVGGTFQSNPQGAEALLSMLSDGFGLHVRREEGQRVYVE
ncbi:FecR domain-containing protein [Luteimonas sp. XNQY3]|nr:FecR domain-containing protein [Luteimonas sp. XNQY3]MCD9006334.1 FecR domain-containing protein [Luteimonas sp. XNQY3]